MFWATWGAGVRCCRVPSTALSAAGTVPKVTFAPATNQGRRESSLAFLPSCARGAIRLAIGIALVSVAGCGAATTDTTPRETGPSTTTTPATGTTGVVQASPTCPVQRPGENCARPVSVGTVTVQPGGQTVALDSTGAFRLQLARDTYTLTVATNQAMSCRPTSVTIRADETTTITIDCDTGIR
jgi:hypothetical protein